MIPEALDFPWVWGSKERTEDNPGKGAIATSRGPHPNPPLAKGRGPEVFLNLTAARPGPLISPQVKKLIVTAVTVTVTTAAVTATATTLHRAKRI